jgi:hypothetical protein
VGQQTCQPLAAKPWAAESEIFAVVRACAMQHRKLLPTFLPAWGGMVHLNTPVLAPSVLSASSSGLLRSDTICWAMARSSPSRRRLHQGRTEVIELVGCRGPKCGPGYDNNTPCATCRPPLELCSWMCATSDGVHHQLRRPCPCCARALLLPNCDSHPRPHLNSMRTWPAASMPASSTRRHSLAFSASRYLRRWASNACSAHAGRGTVKW